MHKYNFAYVFVCVFFCCLFTVAKTAGYFHRAIAASFS